MVFWACWQALSSTLSCWIFLINNFGEDVEGVTICIAGWQVIGKEYTNRPDYKIRNLMGLDRRYQGPEVKKMKSNTDKCQVLSFDLLAIWFQNEKVLLDSCSWDPRWGWGGKLQSFSAGKSILVDSLFASHCIIYWGCNDSNMASPCSQSQACEIWGTTD